MTKQLEGDDLAYAALDYIRENPELWAQHSYFCGSTACYAGTVLHLAGAVQRTPWGGWTGTGGRNAHIEARDLLGWSDAEAAHVFFCFTCEFSELEKAVKEVLNGDLKDEE